LEQGVRALSRREGVTPSMTLLAAYAALLARRSGVNDLVVGLPVAGRTRPEFAGVVGAFVNLLPLRLKLDPAASVGRLLRAVRAAALDAYANQEIPFERIVDALEVTRDLAVPPLVQASFSFGSIPEPVALRGLEVSEIEPPRDSVTLDLMLRLEQHRGGLCGLLAYDAALFAPLGPERFAEEYLGMLREFADEPGAAIGPLLSGGGARAWGGLPDIEADAPAYVPACNTVQEQLVAIWERELRTRPVGVHDDFFELGGHSLLAVRVMHAIGEYLGRPCAVALLFRHPTVAALSAALLA
jgi:non-ribosomal peptide synthetase component F